MSITGEPDGTPMKIGVAITDVLTGLYAAVSVLAGLFGASQRASPAGARGAAFDLPSPIARSPRWSTSYKAL